MLHIKSKYITYGETAYSKYKENTYFNKEMRDECPRVDLVLHTSIKHIDFLI